MLIRKLSTLIILILLPFSVFGEIANLQVPKYDQEEFGHGCTMDCSPTAAAMILGYWDSHGWPRMVQGGSADYILNSQGVTDLVMDLWVTMEYTCSDGTSPNKVAPGIIKTATNMSPGANFVNHSFLEITSSNKDEAFQILKGYINNGWPVIFSSYEGLKYYCPNDASYGKLSGGHSMVMTGYMDSSLGRKIFLNSGWGFPKDIFWVDYDDLGLDLDITDPKQIWITCVVPEGIPSRDFVVKQLTHNSLHDKWPSVHDGKFAWAQYDGHDYEIIYWDGKEIRQITDDQINDHGPSLYNGAIAWYAAPIQTDEIFHWDGQQISQLTNNNYHDKSPSLFDGKIAWYGGKNINGQGDWEIFYWNGSSISAITNNTVDDTGPSLNNGIIAWTQGNEGTNLQIAYWDGYSVKTLTTNPYMDAHPSVYEGTIAWGGWTGSEGNIFFWNGNSIVQFADETKNPSVYYPALWNGKISWVECNGSSCTLYFWDGNTISEITDRVEQQQTPSFNNGIIAWYASDGEDLEIYYTSIAPAYSNPEFYNFGHTAFNCQSKKVFTITNISTEDIQIANINIINSFENLFSVENNQCTSRTLQVSDSCTFEVGFISQSSEIYETTIEVIITDRPFDKIVIKLEGTGSSICKGDLDGDNDQDNIDLVLFSADFGRLNCNGSCLGDLDGDGDVDGSDHAIFISDFGRTECPNCPL